VTVSAVLFDFNGVIIDDEPIHDEAWREVLTPLAITYTDEEYYGPLLGVPDAVFLRLLLERRGVVMDDHRQHELHIAKGRLYDRYVLERPVDLPGLGAFVADLARCVPIGVVSGALRPEIEQHLKRLGIAKHIATILAAGEYSMPKPDPAPYLTGFGALRQTTGCRCPADEVVVIEDSPNGVKSGLAAGMKVLGVTARIPADQLPGCFAYIKDFTGLTHARLDELTGGGPA
jgi:beta-phosphoglucomutase-like phosphatase (HAD superfamily)